MVDPLTRTVRPFKWKRSRKPLSQEIQTTYRVLVVTLLFMGTATTGTYLYMNSLQPAKGYELKQLQIDYEAMQSDLRKLERDVVEAQSFINLEQSEVLQKMHIAEAHDLSYTESSNFAETYDASTNTR